MDFCHQTFDELSKERIHLKQEDHLLSHLPKEDSDNFQKYFEADSTGDISYFDLDTPQNLTIEHLSDIQTYGTKIKINTTVLFRNSQNHEYLFIGFGQIEKSFDSHVNQRIGFQHIIELKKEDIKMGVDWDRSFNIDTEEAHCQYCYSQFPHPQKCKISVKFTTVGIKNTIKVTSWIKNEKMYDMYVKVAEAILEAGAV